jgi:hypothetical protein
MTKMGVFMTHLGVEVWRVQLYNSVKQHTRRANHMDTELKTLITELLDAATDLDLLDLIYKLLASSSPGS